jgi:murein DD-endopeptidase MepM/ murein hydrolase activator NlpD
MFLADVRRSQASPASPELDAASSSGGVMRVFQPRRRFFRRHRSLRGRPGIVLGAAAALALAGGLGWKTAEHLSRPAAERTAVAAAPAQPVAQAKPARPQPQTVALHVRPGETFEAAIQRVGLAPEEARRVVDTLASAMDIAHIKAGLALHAAVARPAEDGPVQLISLTLKPGPTRQLTLSRSFDGDLRLKELEEKVLEDTVAAEGKIEGSLYESAMKMGATPAITAQVVKLFAHKLDFERDIQPGDSFKLVFDRKVTEAGRTVEAGDLEYAELRGVKFYRFERPGGGVEYVDEFGKNIKGFLLRTPVDGARITSGFGMRRHPILGYTRAHQGIDFGAGAGTPILAAGDGVVVEAGRKGGYGNWLRIRHTGAWDTGYGHISRFARGVRPGVHVRQGQVVAYVGSTGLATGPHLHYEIFRNGKRVNPLSAKVPQGTVLAGRELARFKAQKTRIDTLLAQGGSGGALALAEAGGTAQR